MDETYSVLDTLKPWQLIVGHIHLSAQTQTSTMYCKKLLGCWHINDILDKEESIYNDKQLKELLKRRICLDRTTAMMLTDTLRQTHYFFKRVDAQRYLWNNFTSTKQDFGITADTLIAIKIKGIEISKGADHSFPTEYHLFYDGEYLILPLNETVFRLRKIEK